MTAPSDGGATVCRRAIALFESAHTGADFFTLKWLKDRKFVRGKVEEDEIDEQGNRHIGRLSCSDDPYRYGINNHRSSSDLWTRLYRWLLAKDESMSVRTALFRVFYSSSYSFLFLILLFFLAVTPADHIYQTIADGNLGNIFVVGGVYLVTAILAFFIYASRLYTNRTVLAAIPRPYLPIGKGEVGSNVRRIIVKNRQRSALVAWDSRPRDVRPELSLQDTDDHAHRFREKKRVHMGDSQIPISAISPPWGEVVHPGWSSPASDDLPDLQFSTVVAELPNLIEAKAVSLAPPDATYDFMAEFQDSVPPPPDPQVVAMLQRPSTVGLRDYLARLKELEVIDPPELSDAFLGLYEHARFSSEALTEVDFRLLMNSFSELLASMTSFNAELLAELASSDGSVGRDLNTPAPSMSPLGTPLRAQSISDATSVRSGGSIIRHEVEHESQEKT